MRAASLYSDTRESSNAVVIGDSAGVNWVWIGEIMVQDSRFEQDVNSLDTRIVPVIIN